jgi:hypothetical protein
VKVRFQGIARASYAFRLREKNNSVAAGRKAHQPGHFDEAVRAFIG